jgi:hypothetical protein
LSQNFHKFWSTTSYPKSKVLYDFYACFVKA